MSQDAESTETQALPLVVALGSGGGGCGRTTLALELGRVLNRRGVSSVLVDASPSLPVIGDVLERHERWGPDADLALMPGAPLDELIERPVAGAPAVLTLAKVMATASDKPGMSPASLIEELHRLPDRVILLDLPAGPQPYWLDLFILSDVPVVLSGPEAWSVMTLVGYLRAMVRRARVLLPQGRFRSYLVLNGCRDASERDLGEVLSHAIWRRLGHYPRYLGPIDFDDRRWFHLRHSEPNTPLSSSFGLGVQTEELAKRILEVDEFNESRPRKPLDARAEIPSAGWFGLSDAVSAADIRGQYRRLWEGYRRESAISQLLFTDAERSDMISELERTYRALQMSQDELHALGDGRSTPDAGYAATARSARGERRSTPASIKVERAIAAEHCGEYLKKVRKSRQVSLRELSLKTRVGIHHIEAIEALDVENLPMPVYLRGYLKEIARVLDQPVESILDRYLTELAGRRHENLTNPV